MAQSMPQFVLARLIAGMGGGGLPSMSSIVSSDLVPLKKRGVCVKLLPEVCWTQF